MPAIVDSTKALLKAITGLLDQYPPIKLAITILMVMVMALMCYSVGTGVGRALYYMFQVSQYVRTLKL